MHANIDAIMWNMHTLQEYTAIGMFQELTVNAGFRHLQRLMQTAMDRYDVEDFYENWELQERQDAINEMWQLDQQYVQLWQAIRNGTAQRAQIEGFLSTLEDRVVDFMKKEVYWKSRNDEALFEDMEQNELDMDDFPPPPAISAQSNAQA